MTRRRRHGVTKPITGAAKDGHWSVGGPGALLAAASASRASRFRELEHLMNTLAPDAFDTSVARIDAKKVKLDVRELDFYYGKTHSLKGVSIPFANKAVTALIGPSGCGKSTLLRTLNRMFDLYPGQKATGKIMLDGEDILRPGVNLTKLRARIGMVF